MEFCDPEEDEKDVLRKTIKGVLKRLYRVTSKSTMLHCAPNTKPKYPICTEQGPSPTLRELSLPSPDVLVPQSSDEKVTASSYVLSPIIISMAEANKFFGAKEENPYTHKIWTHFAKYSIMKECLRIFTGGCFSHSLWEKKPKNGTKQHLEKQKKLRREVVNFLQKDEESFTEAWTRFQTLLKQGPDLGIEENMCAQTFYMARNKASRMHLDGSAGGSFLRLTAKAGIELLGKIAENEALHKHWEEYLEPNWQYPEVMQKEESPVKQIMMQLDEFELDEFELMDIIPIDFSRELLNRRRSFSPQDASRAGIAYNFLSNRLKSEIFDQEIIGRVLGKLYKDDIELDGTEVKQAKRLLDTCFEPSPYEGLCGVYDLGLAEEEEEEPYIPCEISGKKFLKALYDFGSRVNLMTHNAFMNMPYETQQRLTGTELELIMANGGKTKPLGVIKNVEIEISSKIILEFYPEEDEKIGMDMGDPLDHILHGTDKHTASADRCDSCAIRLNQENPADRHDACIDRLNQGNPDFEPLGELDPDEVPKVEQKELPKEIRYEYLG
ncbi:hypothetical protein PR202_gb26118 [Eleusine coracana subsp. coracana]|uniref:Uncharacterized protein n=1 Tax=Eleusine coracana subsp. coracana TaxID=191504 RepID=A0AAV5FR09_ELECO|nr:hypothetical protein PR202_gb26118 [Eleusine coracana subsp. coracana]